MPGGYHSRHGWSRRSHAPGLKYSTATWQEYERTSLPPPDPTDEARLQGLQERDSDTWSQQDAALYEEMTDRNEQREEAKLAPLRRELEGYFADFNLPPLPPPLAKSSGWLEIRRPCYYKNEDVRPFLVACEEGSLGVVKEWVQDGKKKELLQPIGLQDGLACAAKGNRVDVAKYLLEEGGVSIHGAVVEAACKNRSLPLLELCIQHGYHPNQQIPSRDGHFGIALPRCIDNEGMVRLLLENGADPNVAPFHDNRTLNWGPRATPPMDRTSGLALDRAVKHGNFAVIQMLLEHGADPRYSRPLHELIRLRRDRRATAPDAEDDWRLVMEILLRHGAEINAVTYGAGTPLVSAVANNMWDIVEFLLERGADPRRTQPSTGLDAFAVAAKGAGSPWEEKDDVKEFLDWLSDPNSRSDGGEASRVPNGVLENPLVKIVARVHGKKLGND